MSLIFLLLITIITITTSKCGLWHQFDHSFTKDGPHRINRCQPASKRCDFGWAVGYGYQSLDQKLICNDMEMFYQCNAAQEMLDAYHRAMGLSLRFIGCYDHIVCAPPLPSRNGKFWCQNMNSYDLCVIIRDIIEAANATIEYPVECKVAVMLTDRVPVLNYRMPPEITTTSTTTTIDLNANVTTAPASAFRLISSLGLVVLMFSYLL